jgi:hypothetical protein
MPHPAFPNYGLHQISDLRHASNRLEKEMSTKEHAIETPSPALMQLTPEEAETLREGFRAELANVMPAKADSSSPSVTNINRKNSKTSQTGATKKGAKKGAKKSAAKKVTKKGARKTTKKK